MSRVRTYSESVVQKLLARADLTIVRRSAYDWVRQNESTPYQPPPLPSGAKDHLRFDHPDLEKLAARYAGHPATGHSQWDDSFVRTKIDLCNFRASGAYLAQGSHQDAAEVRYALSAIYARDHDPLGVFGRLGEDGLFGAYTCEVDGATVSRDLIDSVLELSFLEEEWGLSKMPAPIILDIGAGYGRLAHRSSVALPAASFVCTDAVAVSTFVSGYYLAFRGCERARVVPLDEIDVALRGRHIDLAVNIYSFSECPLSAIEWWLDLLVQNDVENLMIVPNPGAGLLSKELRGEGRDFLPLILDRGFELVVKRPKYAHSAAVQAFGIMLPTFHWLFRRSR